MALTIYSIIMVTIIAIITFVIAWALYKHDTRRK